MPLDQVVILPSMRPVDGRIDFFRPETATDETTWNIASGDRQVGILAIGIARSEWYTMAAGAFEARKLNIVLPELLSEVHPAAARTLRRSDGVMFEGILPKDVEALWRRGGKLGHTFTWIFYHPKTMSSLEALRILERDHPAEMYPALATVCYYADHATSRSAIFNGLMGRYVSKMNAQGPEGVLSTDQLRAYAQDYLDASLDAAGSNLLVPRGAVNQAVFLFELGRLMWHPATLARIVTVAQWGTWLVFGSFAIAYGQCRPQKWGTVDCKSDSLPDWLQFVDLCNNAPTASELAFLSGGRLLSGVFEANYGPEFGLQDIASYTPAENEMMYGVANELLRHASEACRFQPVGSFVVELPEGFPLERFGVMSITVCCRDHSMWVGLRHKHGVQVFEWSPALRDELVRPFSIPRDVMFIVDLTMAALWHDLRVAGEAAAPDMARKAKARPLSSGTVAPAPKAKGRAPAHAPVRVLPRLDMSGKRLWGGGDEPGEKVAGHKRAHMVWSFVRRLPPGWHTSSEARQRAWEAGIALAENETYVRAHVRGGELVGGVLLAPVVRAAGLANIMKRFGGQ